MRYLGTRIPQILVAAAALALPGWALAQAQEPIVNPAPLVPQARQLATPGAPPLAAGDDQEAAPTTARTRARHADPGVQLLIEMAQSRIWNPQQQRFDTVRHRAYRRYVDPAGLPAGTAATTGPALYMAPTIEARPGQTVRIDIRNHLPEEPDCQHSAQTMNNPDAAGCYNDTNNHFHGGWVNPAGNGDNVLRKLHPSRSAVYEYEYNIPAEHPAGTFWYHPHVHGSTAIQVGSGMAGALIVRGDRWPMIDAAGALRTGDIDVLLQRGGQPIVDRVLLLQQIQYACHGDADGDGQKWTCGDGEIGEIRDYTDLTAPPSNAWAESGRFTTVNGRVSGMLDVQSVVGVPERWRFIHAGFTTPVGVQVFRRRSAPALAAGSADVFERTPARQQDAVIRRECELESGEIPLFEIATDGLTRPKVLPASQRVLHPGYRSDVLVSFPAAGDYCVIDNQTQEIDSEAGTNGEQTAQRRLLFTVKVLPGADDALTNPRAAITTLMVQAAQAAGEDALAPALLGKVISDLQNDLVLDAFSPHASLAEAPVDNYQHMQFTLVSAVQTDDASVPPGLGVGHVRVPAAEASSDPVAFEHLRFSDNPADTIHLYLGDVDEWRLSTAEPVGHPFHIHVNPFEVIAVWRRGADDAEPVDLTLVPDSHYFGMKGTFKDTIFVEGGVEVVVRSHYERYIGTFVLHCHILYHEDMGMMRLVEIHDPVRTLAGNEATPAHGQGHAGHGVRH